MAGVMEYKCPCCGGAIAFDSSLQKMKCPYCDTEFEMETLLAYDAELKGDREDDIKWKEPEGEWTEGEDSSIRVYICNSCGGEIIGDENTAATSCPFCGNPVVMTGQLKGVLKPDFVIPFRLDKNAAKEALKNHLKGKKLLPKVFKDENHIDEIKGIYVPFWMFDADVDANIRYKGTRVRYWSDRKYDYTETSFYNIIRSGNIAFASVPVDGSSKMPDDLMESIEPFDMSGAVDFQTAYLAGYLADKYDVSSEDSVGRANERVKFSTETAFKETVSGFATLTTEYSNVNIDNGRASYGLLPVWILNTTWRDEKYLFAMNGQTGKFVGNLPVDKKKAWLSWLCGTAVAGAVALLAQYLIWMFA